MEIPKRSSTVHDDRLGASHVSILAHTGLLAGRGVGSPSQTAERDQESRDSVFRARTPAKRTVVAKASLPCFVSTQRSLASASLSRPCARVVETSVWQSPGGAVASLTVTFDETPLTNLGTSDRNPGEMQPRATTSSMPNVLQDTRWEPYVPEWVKWMANYRSKNTAISYEPRVRRVLGRIGKADLREIAYRDVEGCLSALSAEDDGWKPNTRNGYVAALRSFWRWLLDKQDLDEVGVWDIGRKLDTISFEVVLREKVQHPPLTKAEFLRIVEWAESHGDSDWALAARFKWTGLCRIEDVWSLRWSQLNVGPNPTANYKKPSKHGHDLVKLLDTGLARRLRGLKALRQPKPDDPVFGRQGEADDGPYRDRFNHRFKAYAAYAGIGKYVHAHLIRASARSHAESEKADPRFLDRQGGWSVRAAADAYSRYDPEMWREQVRYVALD